MERGCEKDEVVSHRRRRCMSVEIVVGLRPRDVFGSSLVAVTIELRARGSKRLRRRSLLVPSFFPSHSPFFCLLGTQLVSRTETTRQTNIVIASRQDILLSSIGTHKQKTVERKLGGFLLLLGREWVLKP